MSFPLILSFSLRRLFLQELSWLRGQQYPSRRLLSYFWPTAQGCHLPETHLEAFIFYSSGWRGRGGQGRCTPCSVESDPKPTPGASVTFSHLALSFHTRRPGTCGPRISPSLHTRDPSSVLSPLRGKEVEPQLQAGSGPSPVRAGARSLRPCPQPGVTNWLFGCCI